MTSEVSECPGSEGAVGVSSPLHGGQEAESWTTYAIGFLSFPFTSSGSPNDGTVSQFPF